MHQKEREVMPHTRMGTKPTEDNAAPQATSLAPGAALPEPLVDLVSIATGLLTSKTKPCPACSGRGYVIERLHEYATGGTRVVCDGCGGEGEISA